MTREPPRHLPATERPELPCSTPNEKLMSPDHAESSHAARTRQKQARRRACRVSAEGHRYWPLVDPWEVSDGPALTLCLHCGDVVTLQAAFPSYPKPRRRA